MEAAVTPIPMPPSTIDALHAAYEQRAAAAVPGSDDDWRRDHLGVSLIGHECDRYLWLSFRWAARPQHDGKMLRLFERGKREEAWIIDDLRAAGFIVRDRTPEGEQFRMRFGPHVGGSVDGLVIGLLEAPETEHVLEVKTSNAKQFALLKAKGLKAAKPLHYAQVQGYMRGLNLTRAFYVCVCKDTDEIYSERVHLDVKFADKLIARAIAIVEAAEPAERLYPSSPPCMLTSRDGTTWPCQFHAICHGKQMPERSCRTCISCDTAGAQMRCVHHDIDLDPLAQRGGCPDHLTIPAAVNAQVASVDEKNRKIEFRFADGTTA